MSISSLINLLSYKFFVNIKSSYLACYSYFHNLETRTMIGVMCLNTKSKGGNLAKKSQKTIEIV